MSKHPRSSSFSPSLSAKRSRTQPTFQPIKIATQEAAAAVDADPPLQKLLKAVEQGVKKPVKGDFVVYWMRMGDLRGKSACSLQLLRIPY
jgi:deoxyribodipyrimidine photo-lyase